MTLRRRFRDAAILAVAAIFGMTEGPDALGNEAASLAGPLSRVPGAVAGASARALRAMHTHQGGHLGFDTYAYPGDEAMRAWRAENVPYEWVGYYLPTTPCHRGDSWSGKRARLTEMGWGIAVVYVGQQTWDRSPSEWETKYVAKNVTHTVTRRVPYKVRSGGKLRTRYTTKRVRVRETVQVPVKVRFDASKYPLGSCNTNLVSAGRGTLEANDAIARTAAEGFPSGTVIFLDLERMDVIPRRMRDYYVEWTRRVLQDGRYRPGYYVHKANAGTVYGDVKPLFASFGITAEPGFWIAGGRDFSPERQPSGVGHAFASVWQGILDTEEEHNGVKLPIDVSVASVASPSTHALGD